MGRNTTLDNVKGIAILAVVFGHVLRGFRTAGLVTDSFFLRFIAAIVYGFHVQTFFIVAGFLTFKKASSLRFQFERQANLYYPYLLWSAVSWAMAYALSTKVNNPVGINDLITLPLVPIQHFWFILMLMIGTAILGFLRSRTALVIAFTSLLILGFFPVLNWYDAKNNLLFVLAGALLWTGRGLPRPHAGLGIAGFAALAAAAWLGMANGRSLSPPVWFLVQLGGCYAAYAGGCLLSRRAALSAIFGYLGRHSLAIYLVHVLTGAGARVVIQVLRPGTEPVIAIAVSLLCAVLLPLVFEWLAVRLNLARILGLRPLVRVESAKVGAIAPA
jgi:fucose 4-O-acetylase-like acetyltransferase